MATTERLQDFDPKTSPTAADIVFVGNAADGNNEVKCTIGQIFNVYPGISSIGNLTTLANQMIYTTAANTYAVTSVTAYGLTLLAAPDATTLRGTLGLGNISGLNIPLTSPSGGTGVTNPTAGGIAIGEGIAPFNFIPLDNGEVLVGVTGSDPVKTTITAGANVSIVNSAGSIVISSSGSGGFSWTHVTGTTQAMAVNTGYIADNAALVTLTLPATSSIGDEIQLIGKGAGGWLVAQNASQLIVFGDQTTTAGVGGSLASTQAADSFKIVCTVANTEWTMATGPQGNITVV